MSRVRINFCRLPKQWILSRDILPEPIGGHTAVFGDWHVQAAKGVPLVPVRNLHGQEIALIIGWVVAPDGLRLDHTAIDLSEAQTISELFTNLSGRFVLIWREGNNKYFRLDSAGSMSAVVCDELGLIASTTTLLETQVKLNRRSDVTEIFNFPQKRGYLPFGLTSRLA